MTRVLALASSEARLIWRNKLVCATALLLPLGLGALIATDGEEGAWGDVVAMQFTLLLLFCVYATATTSLAARRRQLVLKRLRSGELSDAEILGGLLAPLFALARAAGRCSSSPAPSPSARRSPAARSCSCPHSSSAA